MRALPRSPLSSPSTPAAPDPALPPAPGPRLGSRPEARLHDGFPGLRRPPLERVVTRALLGAALVGFAGCANLEFSRETETAGTFSSSAAAFTIISVDMPRSAIDAARENVTDARQPNLVMTKATIWPYLGPADWLLDIIGFRIARISGTWGFREE